MDDPDGGVHFGGWYVFSDGAASLAVSHMLHSSSRILFLRPALCSAQVSILTSGGVGQESKCAPQPRLLRSWMSFKNGASTSHSTRGISFPCRLMCALWATFFVTPQFGFHPPNLSRLTIRLFVLKRFSTSQIYNKPGSCWSNFQYLFTHFPSSQRIWDNGFSLVTFLWGGFRRS